MGIAATQATHLTVFDSISGIGISCILASMGLYLAQLNYTYLIGQSVDPDITLGIRKILLSRQSIEEVHSEQSQWIGPYAFAYKAEIDIDGTYLAAKLMQRYEKEFSNVDLKPHSDEMRLLLAWYAEDVSDLGTIILAINMMYI